MTFSSDQHPRDKAGRFINGASVQRLIASFPYAADDTRTQLERIDSATAIRETHEASSAAVQKAIGFDQDTGPAALAWRGEHFAEMATVSAGLSPVPEGKKKLPKNLERYTAEMVRSVEEASALPDRVEEQLFRGMLLSPAAATHLFEQDEVHMDRLASWSASSSAAATFANPFKSSKVGVVLSVRSKKGLPLNTHEYETVQAPGARYRVVKRERVKPDGNPEHRQVGLPVLIELEEI